MLMGEPAEMVVENESKPIEESKTRPSMLFDDGEEEQDNDDDDNEAAQQRQHHFLKELRVMMYAFGGDREPYQETLELLEEMTVDYIEAMTVKCVQTGKRGKIGLEDIWYLTRRDHRKYARVKDLLNMSEELKKARKAFDENKFGGSK